jgi:hypothetical protein
MIEPDPSAFMGIGIQKIVDAFIADLVVREEQITELCESLDECVKLMESKTESSAAVEKAKALLQKIIEFRARTDASL